MSGMTGMRPTGLPRKGFALRRTTPLFFHLLDIVHLTLVTTFANAYNGY